METQTAQNTIEKTQWYPHSIDKVWGALTETEHVSKWLAPTNFKGEVGAEYELHSPKDDCSVVAGVVTESTPYTLVYSWIALNHKDIETEVRWNLTKEKNGTKVNMVHSGILKYNKEAAQEMFGSFSNGWKRCFLQIGDVLNS